MQFSAGIPLLTEMKRSSSLPPFNEEVVRKVVEEMQQLDAEIMKTLRFCQENPEEAQKAEIGCMVMAQHVALQRNKRIVLAYINERFERLKVVAQEMSYVPLRLKPHLAAAEQQAFDSYLKLMRSYNKHFDTQHFTLDLSDDLQQPPTDLYVEVRALKELGEMYTADGAFNLQQGTQHTLRRVVAEPLIRQGALEHQLE